MPDEPLYIVTDQGPTTGIGAYANALYLLLRGAFPGLRVLSLCYLPVEHLPGWVRLPGLRFAASRLQVPSVVRHNYQRMQDEIPTDARVHFCGTAYHLVQQYRDSVVTIHDYYPRKPSIGVTRENWTLLRDASSLLQFITLPRRTKAARVRVVPTRFVSECLARRCSLSSTVVHHWIDPDRFQSRNRQEARRALGLPFDKNLLLNVSQSTSNKNYAMLAKVARQLNGDRALVKVGGKLLGIPGVIHIDRLSHAQYPLVFNACDAYVHVSTEEGFGWPLIEAMASELPVVSLRTAVASEVLGDAALFLEPAEPVSEWIAAIDSVGSERTRLELASKEKSRSDLFSSQLALEAYKNVYREAFGL